MIDVNRRATEAGALLEWQALTDGMRSALRMSRSILGGLTIQGEGIAGATLGALERRGLLDPTGASRLTRRAAYVLEVGCAFDRRGLR